MHIASLALARGGRILRHISCPLEHVLAHAGVGLGEAPLELFVAVFSAINKELLRDKVVAQHCFLFPTSSDEGQCVSAHPCIFRQHVSEFFCFFLPGLVQFPVVDHGDHCFPMHGGVKIALKEFFPHRLVVFDVLHEGYHECIHQHASNAELVHLNGCWSGSCFCCTEHGVEEFFLCVPHSKFRSGSVVCGTAFVHAYVFDGPTQQRRQLLPLLFQLRGVQFGRSTHDGWFEEGRGCRRRGTCGVWTHCVAMSIPTRRMLAAFLARSTTTSLLLSSPFQRFDPLLSFPFYPSNVHRFDPLLSFRLPSVRSLFCSQVLDRFSGLTHPWMAAIAQSASMLDNASCSRCHHIEASLPFSLAPSPLYP
eukprot:scaffold684_cov345-Pavlova_lutheri.AAC.29